MSDDDTNHTSRSFREQLEQSRILEARLKQQQIEVDEDSKWLHQVWRRENKLFQGFDDSMVFPHF